MKDLLQFLIEQIVDERDQIKIREEQENSTTVFYLSVAKDDMGKVIGSRGRVIEALRTILKIAAVKYDQRVMLHLLDA